MRPRSQPDQAPRRAARALVTILAAACAAALVIAAPAAQASRPRAVDEVLHAQTHHIRVGRITMAYRSIGSGRPLVIINGTTATMDDWDPYLLARLLAHHRVIQFDNRGTGSSTTTSQRLTVRLMADDAARLFARLKLRRPDVFGCSLGGLIVEDLVAWHPRSVRRDIICAAIPGGPLTTLPTQEAFNVLVTPGGTITSPDVLFHILFTRDPAGRRAAHRFVERLRLWPHHEHVAPSVDLAQLTADARFYGVDAVYRYLPRVRNRTLVMSGKFDPLFPAANGRLIAKRIPRAKLILYPGRHGFPFQFVDRVTSDMLRFLR